VFFEQQFISDPTMKEALEKTGVISEPEVKTLNEVWFSKLKIQEKSG
jgi:hypothetical protein